jgi:hypothetical protein
VTPLKAFLLSHAIWIVIIAVLVFSARAWLSEHDARISAERNEAVLREQVSQRQVEVQKQVQVITRIVHEAQTPEQVVAAIPQLTDMPFNTRTIPNDLSHVQVDAPALVEFAGQCKKDAVQLAVCQKDLSDEKSISASYKKASGHRGFFGKVWGGVQKVGLLGIGLALGKVI